jgi:hypothetical protein
MFAMGLPLLLRVSGYVRQAHVIVSSAYGRLFKAARLRSFGAPLAMPFRIMFWYCALMGLVISMR